MLDDIYDLFCHLVPALFLFLAICIAAGVLIYPTYYFQGKANAKLLMETRGIEMHWSEAAFIHVPVPDVNLNIKEKE